MYAQRINRRKPALLMLLVDQSASMNERWDTNGQSKAQVLADAVNETLYNAGHKCKVAGNQIYDYFQVGVFGYGASLGPVLEGTSVVAPLATVSQYLFHPKRVEQRVKREILSTGEVIEEPRRLPVWIEPSGNGMTPMKQMFTDAEPIVASWCAAHRSSFPPIVINVTDGVSTDGDPSDAADRLRRTGTDDGPTLLFNVHLSVTSDIAFAFPSSPVGLPDDYAKLLFDMSSEVPEGLLATAAEFGYEVEPGARGLLYNSGTKALFQFLNIGTVAVTPRRPKELP
ncbi:vWA domain-containing protein [Nocardia heshunensis]